MTSVQAPQTSDLAIRLQRGRIARQDFILRLASWAAGSMIVGLIVWSRTASFTGDFWRAFAEAAAAQCVLWGVIDAVIAATGLHQAQKRSRPSKQTDAAVSLEMKQIDRLVRLRQFMIKLDGMWIGIGMILVVVGFAMQSGRAVGHGSGLMLQNGFLLLLHRQFVSSLAG